MADFGKINLAALDHKIAEFGQKGSTEKIKCIVIPIDKNHLFHSEKGNVFMDLVMFEMKNPQVDKDGATTQTHIVKQSLPGKVREAMTEDQKRNQPIIGSMNIYQGSTGYIEKPATQNFEMEPPAGDEDLPF